MILITGGLGFIGSHTACALLDLGESCVLCQRRTPEPNPLLAEEFGKRLFIEQLDASDPQALLDVGERYPITGIIHLAGAYFGDAVEDARTNVNTLLNLVKLAGARGARLGVASSIGVYDAPGSSPLLEELPLPLSAHHSIAAGKKVDEILAGYLGAALGIEIYAARIGAIWGPLGRTTSRFFAVPQLVHAAVANVAPDPATLPGGRLPYADDGIDLLYVRDCGRALAHLQLAGRLSHSVYNVSGGRLTTYGEIVDGIAAALPGTRIALPERGDADTPRQDIWLSGRRLLQDTDYRPSFDAPGAVADYIAWLRAGNRV